MGTFIGSVNGSGRKKVTAKESKMSWMKEDGRKYPVVIFYPSDDVIKQMETISSNFSVMLEDNGKVFSFMRSVTGREHYKIKRPQSGRPNLHIPIHPPLRMSALELNQPKVVKVEFKNEQTDGGYVICRVRILDAITIQNQNEVLA